MLTGNKEIYYAAGCFWGAEKYFKLIWGVVSTEVGFANGDTENPTYKEVYTDRTGHAECVHVTYDPRRVSLETLTDFYFKAVDPFSLNRQGEDEGTRYRTGVYFAGAEDGAALEAFFSEKSEELGAVPVVELMPLKVFYRAEEYHQDYLEKHPDGYCHLHPELYQEIREYSRSRTAKIKRVLDWLEANGIEYEIHYHPPLPAIEEALAYWKDIDATHCKNLFFRNHKGNRHYLVSFECHKELDIHALEHSLHQGKLSFASPERMARCLGVTPGSVCAFGLINDMDIAASADPAELFENGHRVKYFLDKDLRNADKVSFHPCDNTASVVLTNEMFMKFLTLWGGEYEWIEI